ncbi:PRC-barrel domain-containing protein [Prosthecobacter sp.]|uniref:PRC-barrel domain-containing protein n=1 Tax=Prosthecobacter sp. TaxID=1965333 RepID=UPI0037847D6F
MKLTPTHLLGGILAASCAFAQVHGAPPASQELAPMVIQGNAHGIPQATGEVDTPKNTFSELIETEVLNYQNEKLGRIKAVTADLEQGRLVEVLVSTRSGMLGLHETLTPVPPSLVTADPRHDVTRINISKARFDAAPKLPRANAASYSQLDRAIASSRYFGVQPWFARTGLGYVQTTADLALMQIKNTQGHYLGKVGLVLMDLPSSRITKIVDDTESMDGNGSHFLPVGALHYNARHSGLVLNSTFAQIKDQAHFRWVHGNGDDTTFLEQTNAAHAASAVQTRTVSAPVTTRSSIAATPRTTVRKAIVAGRPAGRSSTRNVAAE